MSNNEKTAPANVFVNLDDGKMPLSLALKVGQNLIFIRAFSAAGSAYLRRLNMPADCFVKANELPHGTSLPGQAEGTYVVALALVSQAGKGEILIEFTQVNQPEFCVSYPARQTLPFVITN